MADVLKIEQLDAQSAVATHPLYSMEKNGLPIHFNTERFTSWAQRCLVDIACLRIFSFKTRLFQNFES